MANLYMILSVRRTVYQSVPTGGTEKDIHTPTQQETTCLLRDPSTTMVLTNFDVSHQILSEDTEACTVDG